MTGLLAIFQFTSLAMLGWLAAALAPLLIHLFTRKRFRKVTWAAMEYLLAAMKKNQRRIQVEQWILLAVRTLILVVLALALADPVLSQMNVLSFGGTTPPTHYIFVVDATYSMDLRRDGVTRFQAAKDTVRDLVERSPQGDGFSLVLLAEPPRVVIGEPAFDRDDLLEELSAATLTHGLGDFDATLAEVESIAATARKEHSRLALTRIVLLTDLERSTWESALSDAAHSRLKQLAESASISLVDLGVEGARNAAIVQAEISDAPVTLDREFTIEARLEGYGEGNRAERLVTLLVDEEAVAQQSVELDSAGHGAAAFRHRFASPGDHTIEIRLADDALLVDNHRWLSVPVREALRVLCIYGRPGETRFVALALEPDKSPSARVRVEESPDTALLEKDLSAYDAVVLVNLPQLDAEQALVLQSYVTSGGGLVVFPGDQTKVGDFLPNEQSSLLPATFASLAPTAEYRFVPLEYQHELIAPFRGFEKAGLLTTPIWKYVRLDPATRDDVRIAMSFDTGDPAIVEGRFGQGRVIMFATAASRDSIDRSANPPTPWTELSTWPSFPPLMQESLALVARSREEGRNRLVGEPLSSLVRNALPDTVVTISPPAATDRAGRPKSGDSRQVQLQSEGDAWRWVYGDTSLSGIYSLTIGPPADRVERFALNIDPRESAVQRIDETRLPPQLERSNETGAPSVVESGSTTAVYAWFRPLLLAVLALLVVESFLARWFGGGRA